MQEKPLCQLGLAANSVLFFCDVYSKEVKDVFTAYNDWSKKHGKNFNLTADETGILLSCFDTFLFHTTPSERKTLMQIELTHMSPNEKELLELDI